jgi:hypothetical protein
MVIAAVRSYDSSNSQTRVQGPQSILSSLQKYPAKSSTESNTYMAKRRCSERTNCQAETIIYEPYRHTLAYQYGTIGCLICMWRPSNYSRIGMPVIRTGSVCQTQEQSNRGPLTRLELLFWDEPNQVSIDLLSREDSTIQRISFQRLGTVEDHQLAVLGNCLQAVLHQHPPKMDSSINPSMCLFWLNSTEHPSYCC